MEKNSDYKYDLKIGKKGENLYANLLENETVEVKTDFKALKTGNLFIEFKSRGKPSGIVTTQATWWCFLVANDLFIRISTERLKGLARKFYNKGKIVKGGDSDTSDAVLVPIEEVFKIN